MNNEGIRYFSDGHRERAPSECFDGFEWLAGKGGDHHSQYGEDGFIDAALERIGRTNRFCFEVGAGDGVKLSNTRHLIETDGWHALLIEADVDLYRSIPAADKTVTVHEKVTRKSLDALLVSANAPLDLDFGSIDIDGQDWHVWDGLVHHRPRLLLIEFERGSDVDLVPELGATNGQATLSAILRLGKAKGYFPMVRTHVNVLFVAVGVET